MLHNNDSYFAKKDLFRTPGVFPVSGYLPEFSATVALRRLIFFVFLLTAVAFSQSKGGRWTFENNGDDIAEWDATNNPGVLQNMAMFDSSPPLQEGNAYLWLDTLQTHNFLLIDDSNDLDFDDENIGISGWIYPVLLNDVHYLINKGEQKKNPKTTNYALRISNGTNHLEFLIRDANNQAQVVASNFTIVTGQWQFVAAFYDFTAGKVYMWNNPVAEPADTLDFNQSFFSNSEPLAIGSWFRDDPANPSIKDFKGKMDDVRISGRLADILPVSTGITRNGENISAQMALHQNYPNPFNPATRIAFDIPQNMQVQLIIYNSRGQNVAKLVDGRLPSGRYETQWSGQNLPSGVYYYQLIAGTKTQTRKMLLVK